MAETAALGRKPNDAVQPAGITVHPDETARQNAAVHKRTELAFDKRSNFRGGWDQKLA
jgi:hypothetical protein